MSIRSRMQALEALSPRAAANDQWDRVKDIVLNAPRTDSLSARSERLQRALGQLDALRTALEDIPETAELDGVRRKSPRQLATDLQDSLDSLASWFKKRIAQTKKKTEGVEATEAADPVEKLKKKHERIGKVIDKFEALTKAIDAIPELRDTNVLNDAITAQENTREIYMRIGRKIKEQTPVDPNRGAPWA